MTGPQAKGGEPAAIFDLGQTLVHGDPMWDLAVYLREQGLFDTARWPEMERGMHLYRDHLAPYEEAVRLIMESFARAVAGVPLADFRAACGEFYRGQYRTAVFPYSRALVDAFNQRGYVTVGITGIGLPLAEIIADDLGLRHIIGTVFPADADACLTGSCEYHSEDGWKGPALDEAAARWGLDLGASFAFGDSEADAPMFERVAQAICLNARHELLKMAEARNWQPLPAATDPLPAVLGMLAAR